MLAELRLSMNRKKCKLCTMCEEFSVLAAQVHIDGDDFEALLVPIAAVVVARTGECLPSK